MSSPLRAARGVIAELSRSSDAYMSELCTHVGMPRFSRDGKAVTTHGQRAIQAFLGSAGGDDALRSALAGLEGDWQVFSPQSEADDAYGKHRMLFRPPLRPVVSGTGVAKGVAFVSHLDTVYPDSVLAEHGHVWDDSSLSTTGWIRGPGTMDCSGGTILARASLDALKLLHSEAYADLCIHIWLNAAEEPLCWDFAPQCRRWAEACGAVGISCADLEPRSTVETAASGMASPTPTHAVDASARSMDASARSMDASARSMDASARSMDASARSMSAARLLECEGRLAGFAPESVAVAVPHTIVACLVMESGITRFQQPDGSPLGWTIPSYGDDDDIHSSESASVARSMVAVPLSPSSSGASCDSSASERPEMQVVLSRRGMVVWRVRIRGKAAHSGNALRGGRSALLAAARLVVAIELANEEEELFASKTGTDRAAVTLNVGRIESGTTHNTVAADAELMIEMRADAGPAYRRGLAKLCAAILLVDSSCGPALPCDEATLQEAALLCEAIPAPIGVSAFAERQADGISITVEERVRALPWQRTDEADAVLGHIKETAEEFGVACKVQVRGGLSDANNLWALAPTVDALGPHGLGAHRAESTGDPSSPAEKVYWPSMIPKAVLLAEVISRIC